MTPDNGVIAQLGERFHGMEEVVGSIPSNSTKNSKALWMTAMSMHGRGRKIGDRGTRLIIVPIFKRR